MSLIDLAHYQYDHQRECRGCSGRDELELSRYILAFQVAEELLARFGGQWQIEGNKIVLAIQDCGMEIGIGCYTGLLASGPVQMSLLESYDSFTGIKGLTDRICTMTNIQTENPAKDGSYLFVLMAKLVQIFHARCNLRILPVDFVRTKEWEISIGDDQAKGWLNEKGIARNRFGQAADTKDWQGLRPEKAATYLFGFYSFCQNYRNPLR
ncbi:hypothetical protein Sgly_2523 [Syntrophobotulus glycolicus DSM 8271]|uniref:Uncharacterized protein n=1 Tax=Syntrophobotulus glycolicus (strain DSM 8271 / FlGlyR) TaxID=645991 RepID=F0SW23_SYNGF|nr:hypothetical protein [Syntrophobotulus glycolicus]ADY56807.1 hypothetical protein Sgly_2523 [Syntrophobotulus glycolicus DSM 8271]